MAGKGRYGLRGEKLKTGESYHAGSGRYMYRWTTRYGERKTVYGKSLVELREKEEKIRRDLADGIRTGSNNLTLNDMFELWRSVKVGLKENTMSNYVYLFNHFARESIGTLKIQSIRKSDLLRFYNSLIGQGKNKVAINTLENIHNVLHQVFQLAVDDDYLRKNPATKVLHDVKKAHGYERPKRHALTISEQVAFLDYIRKTNKYKHWLPLFTVFLGTGLRAAELIGLRWQDIDMENDMIDINHNLVYFQNEAGKCGYHISTPKTSAGRRKIPMLPEVKQAFLDEKEYQREAELFCNFEVDGFTDFVFLNRDGKTHNSHSIDRAIKRILRDYNDYEVEKAEKEGRKVLSLPDFSCHHLRHSFATRCNEKEMNMKIIQALMGHSSVVVTMDTYTHISEDKLKESFGDMKDIFISS